MIFSILGKGRIGNALQEMMLGSFSYGRNDDPETHKHNILIVAAPNGKRIDVINNPKKDKQDCLALMETIKNCEYDHLIYLSTCDVIWSDSVYADNRRFMEQQVSKLQNVYIMRLSKALAPGLTRSILWDIKHNSKWLYETNLDATMQWYPLRQLQSDISCMITAKIKIADFASKPISNRSIVERFAPKLLPKLTGRPTPIIDINKDGKYSVPIENVWQEFDKFFIN